MNIAIRVNASKLIGTGHFYRSFILAQSLKSSTVKIFFICDNLNKLLVKKLKSENFNYYILNKRSFIKNYQERDIHQTLNVLKKIKLIIDLLIVDSYLIGKRWEKKVSKYVKNLMVIDDLNRIHCCNIFLNQNFFVHTNVRKLLPKKCKILVGPKYCLLNSNYRNEKKKIIKTNYKIKNVMIFMGGSDTKDLTTKILKILSKKEFLHLNLFVVIGINNIRQFLITKLAKLRPNTSIYYNLASLNHLIKKSDIAISSGGSTISEFIFFGLSSLVINQADNQIDNSKYLDKAGVIKLFKKKSPSVNNLRIFFKKNLLKNNFTIPEKFFKLLDGKGHLRVKRTIEEYIK